MCGRAIRAQGLIAYKERIIAAMARGRLIWVGKPPRRRAQRSSRQTNCPRTSHVPDGPMRNCSQASPAKSIRHSEPASEFHGVRARWDAVTPWRWRTLWEIGS